MKLYATTTSERASKGQGGNKYIEVTLQKDRERYSHTIIYTENGLVVYKMVNNQLQPVYIEGDSKAQTMNTVLSELEEIEKGEKQKGEKTCPQCGGDVWDLAKGYKLNKCHNCGLSFE